jgi:hypothetical protein
MTVQLVNMPLNQNPEITNVRANSKPVLPNEVIELYAGDSLYFQFNTADANPTDSVTILVPQRALGTYTTTAGIRPSGSFRWKAEPLLLPGQIVYVPIVVKDNACPVPGLTTQVYGVKVRANPLAIKENVPEAINFTAFPNPFSDKIYFRCNTADKAETILIYNLLGQQIDEIQLKMVGSGEQKVQWQNAAKHTAGIYIAKLIAKDKTSQTLKFTKLQ